MFNLGLFRKGDMLKCLTFYGVKVRDIITDYSIYNYWVYKMYCHILRNNVTQIGW